MKYFGRRIKPKVKFKRFPMRTSQKEGKMTGDCSKKYHKYESDSDFE